MRGRARDLWYDGGGAVMRCGWMVALFALISADPARADVTARYSQPDGPPIVIQANDRGDSRMAVTDGVYVSRNGVTHMILTLRDSTIVVRQEDFLAVIAEFVAAARPPGTPAGGRIEISEHGREMVGGRGGTVFRVSEAGEAQALEFVISTDADLAPIARAFRAQFLPFFAAQGASPPGVTEAMTDLLSRGALIRFGDMFRLESIDATPVAEAAFDLPSAPISRDALRARLLSEADR